MEKEIILSVRGLSKKFSRDIKYNLFYGIKDLFYESLLANPDRSNLRKEEFWAINNIEFDLFAGEILGIIGPNGSGKTTLMRLLSNIYKKDQGNILGDKQQSITAIFALKSGMQPLFTGRENIYIKGAMFGMSEEQINQQLDFITEFSELEEYLDMPFGNYSSGMKARLAFSIALATEPDIFIIDEALAVGDSLFRSKCFDHLRAYVKQERKAVLFVSNGIRKILELASRVLVMDKGKVVHQSSDVKKGLEFYINNCMAANANKKAELKKIQLDL